MVALADAIRVLFPNSVPLVDWRVQDSGSGPQIAYWNAALGAQPSQATLNAVTQAQVDAARATALRNAAKTLFAASNEFSETVRGAFLVVLDTINRITADIRDIQAAIVSPTNTTLNQIKTAVNAVSVEPARTASEFKAAVDTKIDAGEAD